MEFRKIKENEMEDTKALIMKTFLEYEAPDYTEEGIQEFTKCIEDNEWISKIEFLGAFEDEKIIGVIGTRNLTHIALFFVDGKYQGKGVGRKLYDKIVEKNQDGFFTVNSSPYAHEIYKHLGFQDTSEKQCINGLIFWPMQIQF